MLKRKGISFLLISAFAICASVIIATRYGRGQTAGPQNGAKVKVLRRKNQLHIKPSAAEIASNQNKFQEGPASSPKEERELEDKIPAHLPIRIKIRKEKEKAFKDLKNERWARDFEVEITNTGDKPIYFLYLLAVMPEIRDANGYKIAFAIFYGRTELGDIRTKANADDVSLKPGETYVFKNSEGVALSQALGFEAFQRKQNWSQPKKLQLKFEVLSFGDGTGYAGEDGVALPHARNEQSSLSDCADPPNKMRPKNLERQAFLRGNRPVTLSITDLPASFLPVNFFASKPSKPKSLTEDIEPDCCPGCSTLIPSFESPCVNCPPQQRPGITYCGSPAGSCYAPEFDSITCIIPGGEEFLCQTVALLPCGTPPPPPTPTPSPTPTPTPTPEHCPLNCTDPTAAFAADPCDPNHVPSTGCPMGYTQTGNCCYSACPLPTSTPPACPSNTLWWDDLSCDWVCLPPIPPSGGGGGGDGGGGYGFYCTEYWWVWYSSDDGGETWYETGVIEYAGCW